MFKNKGLLIIPVVVICGLLLGQLLVKSFAKLTLSDFHVYYYITRAVVLFHDHPYANFTPIYPYFFPPASIVLFAPLIFIPFYISKIVWTILNGIFLLMALWLLCKTFFGKVTNHIWLMLLAALLFYPIRFTFTDGQFNVAMLFIYTLGLYAIVKNKWIQGGIALGIGVFTKISPALIVAYAFFRKKFKLVIVAGLTVLLFSIAAEFVVRKDINYYYVKNVISRVSSQSNGLGWTDQSLLAFIKRVVYTASSDMSSKYMSLISYSVIALAGLVFLVIDFTKKKGKFNIFIDYFILTVVGVVGTGLAWYHQFTVLMLPLLGTAILCFTYMKKHKVVYLAGLAVVYFFWFLNLKRVLFVVGFLQPNMLYGAVLFVIGLFVLRAHQDWLSEEPVEMRETKNYLLPLFLVFVFLGMAPWSIRQQLKEGRDLARIEAISYMGNVLKSGNLKFKLGESNSLVRSNKINGGYILFEKREHEKVLSALSILYLDPINNYVYNYKFSSVNGINFDIEAKLESIKYKNTYGDVFSVMW